MKLSEELHEATARYFVRTKAGKTAGGPYPSLDKLAAGIGRAMKRGLPKDQLLAQKFVAGEFHDLSPDEMEGLVANLDEITEETWRPRPRTPAHRVMMTLKGPEAGVDPDWWRTQFGGATHFDVEQLDLADVRSALTFAGKAVPSDEKQARVALQKAIGSQAPESRPAKRVRWSEMSKEDQESAIDDAQIAYAEGAGRRLSRKQAAELLAKRWA